jgi:hypothetical protein
MSMFYCLYFLRISQLEGQVPVFISSRNGVAQLYPLASKLYCDRRSVGEFVQLLVGLARAVTLGCKSIRTQTIFTVSFETPPNWRDSTLERFQLKVLRLIVNAPWYVLNSVKRKDLRIPSVKEEISRFSFRYALRLRTCTNERTANPQASAPILAQRPSYQILAHCSPCNSCL